MIRVVKFDLLLKCIACTTVILSILSYYLVQNIWFPNYSIFKVITISFIISTTLIFILLNPFFFRKIWAFIAFFNKSLFPDLNGTWQGEIHPENSNVIKVRSVIRQSLLVTQIDMHGETMKSITLETTPTVEQGQNKLYYVYRCTPRNPSRPTYNGSTLFDIRVVEENSKKILELSGHYYTDRKTIGRVALKQVFKDFNKDVSYY